MRERLRRGPIICNVKASLMRRRAREDSQEFCPRLGRWGPVPAGVLMFTTAVLLAEQFGGLSRLNGKNAVPGVVLPEVLGKAAATPEEQAKAKADSLRE